MREKTSHTEIIHPNLLVNKNWTKWKRTRKMNGLYFRKGMEIWINQHKLMILHSSKLNFNIFVNFASFSFFLLKLLLFLAKTHNSSFIDVLCVPSISKKIYINKYEVQKRTVFAFSLNDCWFRWRNEMSNMYICVCVLNDAFLEKAEHNRYPFIKQNFYANINC